MMTPREELVHEVDRLLTDYAGIDSSAARLRGKQFKEWFLERYSIHLPRTPRGGKKVKQQADRLLWSLVNAPSMRSSVEQGTNEARQEWIAFSPHVDDLIRLFGAKSVLREKKTPNATYLNLKGLTPKTFLKYVAHLDSVLSSLKGWRKGALGGDFKVALAGPDKFRGTVTGVYKRDEDTMYVRATPKVMRRSKGYASPEYILIHEMGHRYENRHPHSIYGTSWYTTRYSMSESGMTPEAFAELFALGHFGIRSERQRDFGEVVDRFEKHMQGEKTAAFRERLCVFVAP